MPVNMFSKAVSKHSQIYTNTRKRRKRKKKKKYHCEEDCSLNHFVFFAKELFFGNRGFIRPVCTDNT